MQGLFRLCWISIWQVLGFNSIYIFSTREKVLRFGFSHSFNRRLHFGLNCYMIECVFSMLVLRRHDSVITSSYPECEQLELIMMQKDQLFSLSLPLQDQGDNVRHHTMQTRI